MANNKGHKRRFGSVRQYRSGRWTAAYIGPDGVEHRAPETFETSKQAEIWLSQQEADITRLTWSDPEAGKIEFEAYAATWLADHPRIGVRTRDLYEGLLRIYLNPEFGTRELREIKRADVRRWYSRRSKEIDKAGGVGKVTHAKCYRLLHAIMNTAVDDELIRANPCRIEGAGVEKSPERPTLSMAEVFRLADAITSRYRMLVLLAGFCGLRWGELAALRRNLVDLDAGTVKVEVAVSDLKDGSRLTKEPKSEAGKRTVHIPDALLAELRLHMAVYAEQKPDGLVFVGPKGAQVRRSTFSRPWKRAITAAELPGLHVHDLRHTANTMAADTGATLKELMARMGHSTTKAAIRYLHKRDDRDKKIADGMSQAIKKDRAPKKRKKTDGGGSGADLVRNA